MGRPIVRAPMETKTPAIWSPAGIVERVGDVRFEEVCVEGCSDFSEEY